MGVANGFRQSMGGEWAEQRKLSKFIVDWENIIVRIELEMCINFAQVYLRNGKSKN